MLAQTQQSCHEGPFGLLKRFERAQGPCVAKVESSATRPHPLDSLGFPCRKTRTQNFRLVRRVLRQTDRGTESKSPVFAEQFTQMTPGAKTVGPTPCCPPGRPG